MEACLDVLEGAARGLERVLPHRDWELFLHYDFVRTFLLQDTVSH